MIYIWPGLYIIQLQLLISSSILQRYCRADWFKSVRKIDVGYMSVELSPNATITALASCPDIQDCGKRIGNGNLIEKLFFYICIYPYLPRGCCHHGFVDHSSSQSTLISTTTMYTSQAAILTSIADQTVFVCRLQLQLSTHEKEHNVIRIDYMMVNISSSIYETLLPRSAPRLPSDVSGA